MKHTRFDSAGGTEINFENEKYTKELMHQYGAALELDAKILADWLNRAVQETGILIQKMGMRLIAPEPQVQPEQATLTLEDSQTTLAGIMMQSDCATGPAPTYPSGKPYNARDLLLAGVVEMTQTIASGKFQLNSLVLQLLEILHSSLGFQFVTASLKDARTEQYVARISLGQDWHKKQKNFCFPSRDAMDLFHLALKNNVDLMIGETGSEKIHRLRPDWHLAHFPDVKSLMILPLIVHGKPIGLIYAERDCEASEGVPPDETGLIKTMKNQLIAAMSR